MAEESNATQRASTRMGAISLSYDGADPSHLEIAVPSLLERGLPATFFLPSVPLLESSNRWIAAHQEGFEMASHSLDDYTDSLGNLPNWTLDMVEEDLRMSRKLLTELFPHQADYAFAYPGRECVCVSSSYDQNLTSYTGVVSKLFRVSKGVDPGTNLQTDSEVSSLKSFDAFEVSARELQSHAERAIEERSWAILNIRGIGSGSLSMDRREHDTFLDWLLSKQMSVNVVSVLNHANQLLSSRISG